MTSSSKLVVDQWIRMTVSADGKTEIGQVKAINGDNHIITTMSGFDLTAKTAQLRRAVLIVLDLNGVLVHRTKGKSVQVRPHVKEFLQFLIKNFVVAVWSSCIPANGEAIVEKCFGNLKKRLQFCWFREECTPHPTPDNPYGTIKDLTKIWSKFPNSFSETNTIIIDDSPEKCSHPKNAFCPYTYGGLKEGSDDNLMQVMQVLRQVLDADSLEPVRLAMTLSAPPTHCREEDEDDAEVAPVTFETK